MRNALGLRPAVVLLVSIAGGGACSSGSSDRNPVAPSAIVDPNTVTSAPGGGVSSISYPDVTSGTMDVTFPPRNEPLAFRGALEGKYRDGLRRSAVQTFVDQEGTVVWAQEYLRYRVNLCPHSEAVIRVLRQIDGLGIQPTCGTTSTATFPPRNEPFDFMVQLEAKYRDGLRRPSQASFVDVEGNIIWTQEYLRYRVSGCAHDLAQTKVFDQIDGRGVQADCASSGVFTGTWRGIARSTSCTAGGGGSTVCSQVPALSDTLVLVLNQSGNTVTGTINLGGFVANGTGTANGNRLTGLSGRTTSQGITIDYDRWDTTVSGSSMTGTFSAGLSGPGGFASYAMTLTGVGRASQPDTNDRLRTSSGLDAAAAALKRTP
jgi:hypothetical protein